MNQILSTKLNKKNNKQWFKFQFGASILIFFVLIIFIFVYYYNLQKKENLSNALINNYSIYRLYSNQNSSNDNIEENVNGLFGIIQIPKLNLYYPVFSWLSEDLLKIAPCKFYGETPNKFGNICIAGHNYHNSSFFSKLSTLSKDDEIYIFDNNGHKYVYFVYNIYEVEASDFSPVYEYYNNEKILTLFTCDNLGENRVIVKSIQKSS